MYENSLYVQAFQLNIIDSLTLYGVYNVHVHRTEVELIPNGDQVKRYFWEIQIEENQITLKLLNSDTMVIRKFKRIRELPD